MDKVAVYCGSHTPKHPSYTKSINELADEFIKNGIDLVYGGASVGLMGAIARRCLDGGCSVIGVIPDSLAIKEIVNEACTEMHQVETMHERKKMMMDKADAFVVFPGGIGTMEEFFEVWTWSSIGLLNKPIGLLNVDGYFDSLLAFFARSQEVGLLRPEANRKLVVSSEPVELIKRLSQQSANVVLHVLDEEDFSNNGDVYGEKALARDGFIHCCLERQLKGVIARYYSNKTSVSVMKIDVSKLNAPLIYENTSGGVELFPHLYGHIPRVAIQDVNSSFTP